MESTHSRTTVAFIADEGGQSTIEYCLLVAMVALTAAIALSLLGAKIIQLIKLLALNQQE